MGFELPLVLFFKSLNHIKFVGANLFIISYVYGTPSILNFLSLLIS
jgi:hypothetical protein